MQPRELLIQARDLISTQQKWCQQYYAKNNMGQRVDPHSVTAISFCAVGALFKAYTTNKGGVMELYPTSYDTVLKYLTDQSGYNCLTIFNDNKKHSDIIKLFDDTIALIKEN